MSFNSDLWDNFFFFFFFFAMHWFEKLVTYSILIEKEKNYVRTYVCDLLSVRVFFATSHVLLWLVPFLSSSICSVWKCVIINSSFSPARFTADGERSVGDVRNMIHKLYSSLNVDRHQVRLSHLVVCYRIRCFFSNYAHFSLFQHVYFLMY